MVYSFSHCQACFIYKDIAACSSLSGSGIDQDANNELLYMG